MGINAGLFDWAGTCHMTFASGISGCTVSMDAEAIAFDGEALMQCWLDAYHSTGAPKLEFGKLMLHYKLSTLIGSYGIFGIAGQMLGVGGPEVWQGAPTFKEVDNLVKAGVIHANYTIGMLYHRFRLIGIAGDMFWDSIDEMLQRW